MARIRSKKSALQALTYKFGGMGKHTPLEPLGAEDMCNFRILPNGVLKVRSGYTCKKHFSSGKKVRGFWEGVLEGVSAVFAVVGDTVYSLTGDTMNETNAGTVADGTGAVHFCVYEDSLYLLDGEKIQIYMPATAKFAEIEPYVPLYGYQWNPSSYGEINEQINLITPRMRVHYYNSGEANVFTLPYYASSVDVVYVNGRKSTNYTFSANSNQITFTSSTPPITAEIGFTVSLNEELRSAILSAQMSYIYSRHGENQLMLWGNDGRLYCARQVSKAMMSSCQTLYPKASSLYFCADDIFFLGDFVNPVCAVCPLYEILLVFTPNRIWKLSFEKDGMQVTLAMSGMGCASPYGVIPYGSGILAAMNGGIYNITASPARPEDLFPERISIGVDEKFASGFTDKVHFMRNFAEGEIWMRDPTDTTGTVWVWNAESEEWYRFGGIHATFFFNTVGNLGFAKGSDICLFGRAETTDNGSVIDAYYKSAYLDFGASDSIRRSMRALLYAAANKNNSRILLETEQEKITYTLKTPTDATSPQLHDVRIHTHRYRFLRFTISVSASYPVEFYKLDIYSKP